ncbi:hypothetical protein D3C78_662580 [compost metagenome]
MGPHALHLRCGEMLAGVLELQGQRVFQRNQQGQRVTGLLTGLHLGKAQALRRSLLQSFRHGIVLEHQQRIKQPLTALPRPTLDIEQRRVLVVAQG